MPGLSYFTRRLCKNVGCAKAAPRLVARGVGWADVHIFFTKMKPNSYKMFGKINFKLFSIRCFSIFIFFYLKILFSIPGEGKFFCLISDKDGGWKNVCKSGVPRMGMGDTSPPPRLPPSAVSTLPDKMEKN